MGNKTPSYENPDFLNGNLEYGVVLLEVDLKEHPQPNNQNINQMVLEFPILPKSGLVLNQNNDSSKFDFKIPFSKDAFQKYFDNLDLLIHYANTSSSNYDGKFFLNECIKAIIFPKTQSIILQNSKLNSSTEAKFSIAIVGNNIINDFLNLNFVDSKKPVTMSDFRKNLDLIIDLFDSKITPFFSDDHLAGFKHLASQEGFNSLLEGFQRRQFRSTEDSEVFLKYVDKFGENLHEVNVTQFWNLMGNSVYESAKMNFRKAFFKVLENVRKKTSLKPFFKTILDLKCSLQELQFYENKNQIVEEFFSDSWLFDIFLLPGFQSNDSDVSNLLKFLIQNYGTNIDDYLRKNRQKLENNMKLPKNNIHYYYLTNFLESPEFHQIDLKVLKVYEQNEQYDGPEIQHLVKINGPAFRIHELKNIVIIAEQSQKLTMHITHTFLMGLNYMDVFPAQTALFFLSETLPEISNFQKFYDLTYEQFQKGEIPQDDVLIPIGCVDIKKNPVIQGSFGEAKLEKVASGKFLSAIVLEGKFKDQTPQTKAIGCYGFLDKEIAEKYTLNLFERPMDRLHIYWKSKNLHGDARYSAAIKEKEILGD